MSAALSNERLDLASAVILESESRGTHDHILLSQNRDFSNLEGQVPRPPPMSRRAVVEVFEPASTGDITDALFFCITLGILAKECEEDKIRERSGRGRQERNSMRVLSFR
jgi:hypothetical protein